MLITSSQRPPSFPGAPGVLPVPGQPLPLPVPVDTNALNGMNGALVRPGMPGPPMTGFPASGMTPLPGMPNQNMPTPLASNRPAHPDDPVIPHNGWQTHEEAEKAFFHLLKKTGVDPDWTWDMTMRAIITDPLYKSFNSLAERKASWQRVCQSRMLDTWLSCATNSTLSFKRKRKLKKRKLAWASCVPQFATY